MKYVLILVMIAACSSKPDKPKTKASVVDQASFRKTKPLTNAEISEFYQGNSATLNPALSDETLDRHSVEELAALKTDADVLMQISVLCSKRDFDNAFLLASKNFNMYQKVAPFWNQLANCHLNQGSYRKALLFYNKALEVVPNFVPALNNIGVMYARQGQDQKALVAFERANKQSKFSKTPRYNLAKIYLTYGLTDQAVPLFSSLLSASPNDVDLLNALAVAKFIQSDYSEALAYYQKIPQTEWKRAEIGLNLAFTLKRLGKSKDAVSVFNQIVQPKSGNLKRYFSVVRNQLGDAE